MLRLLTFTLLGLPLSQSYGDNLPSSLGRFHSLAFGYLPSPTSVGFGTVTLSGYFSAVRSTSLRLPESRLAITPHPLRDYRLGQTSVSLLTLPPCVTSIDKVAREY